MKVFWFIIAGLFFVGGFALFGYAFTAEDFFGVTDLPAESLMFFGGVVAVAVSFAIPFHLLEQFD